MSSVITPQVVQNIFSLYLNNKLIVNRRYQRKLVWTIEEKQKFIDSLIQGYPIPMILTSKHDKEEGTFEILDGLQRLNAITSFIEGDFPINGQYFDLESISLTKHLKDTGSLKQKQPILDGVTCSTILNYNVPFLTTHTNTPEFIDETFRRINTGGKRLSRQDVRQAGALEIVPETINKISNYVRRDSSRTDLITLKNMKNISIGDETLQYGINIHEIFWVKQEIIRKHDIRESRDEELIAYLLSYILKPEDSHTTAEYLDQIFDSTTEQSSNLTNELNKYDTDYIVKTFNYVFDELMKIFKSDRNNFSKTIFQDEKRVKSSRCFQVIFLAIYDLIVKDGKVINNHKNLHQSLDNFYHQHYQSIMNTNRKWHNSDRTKLIKATKGVITEHFSESKSKQFEAGNWIKNLENIINESQTEQQSYDFKMGLYLYDEQKLNKKLIDKILQTLTAMTNSTHGECSVIVGVAENEDDAKKHENQFSKSYIKYSSKYIVGIDSEASALFRNIDIYLKTIKEYIQHNKLISDPFKTEILNKLTSFTYKEKEILIFRAERQALPETFDGKYYERHLSHNSEIKAGPETAALFKRFS